MSAERIDRLHEKASESYLNGDYRGAIVAWRELLTLDPANEHALEGVRMSMGLGGDDPVAAAEGARARAASALDDRSLEAEIEDGLAVLGALPPPARAPAPDERYPDRQGQGIDVGEIESIAAIPPVGHEARNGAGGESAVHSGQPAWGGVAEDPSLIDLQAPGPAGPDDSDEPASVAEDALRQRVLDLLDEARECRDQGDIESALGVISRIYILDESNAEARALEAELRAPGADDPSEVEGWLVEGVQAFDQGHLAESADFFRNVLQRVPGHREAIQYLDAIAARELASGAAPGDLLDNSDLLGDLNLDEPALAEPAFSPPVARAPSPSNLDGSAAPSPPSRSGPSLDRALPVRPRWPQAKWAMAAGIGVVIVLGVVLVAKFTGGEAASEGTAVESVATPRPPRRAGAPRAAVDPQPSPTAPASQSVSPDAALTRARAAMQRGDYGASVLAFNEVLAVDPANPEAVAGFREAGELYKASKAEQEQIEGVKASFRAGEFASALRVLYRLPSSYDKAALDRWKVHGWFNLGVIALRAGETSQAVAHFDEALAIRADDEVSKWRSFAQHYRNRPKDRTFYDAAEAIRFRTLD